MADGWNGGEARWVLRPPVQCFLDARYVGVGETDPSHQGGLILRGPVAIRAAGDKKVPRLGVSPVFLHVAGRVTAVVHLDAVEGELQKVGEEFWGLSQTGVGEKGEASGGMDEVNGFLAGQGGFGHEGLFPFADVLVEGALHGWRKAHGMDFLGDVNPSERSAASAGGDGFHREGNADVVKPLHDAFRSLSPSGHELAQGVHQTVVLRVNTQPQHVDFVSAMPRADLGPGEDFQSEVPGCFRGWRDSRHGVVVGDGDGGEARFRRALDDAFRAIGAIGVRGVKMEVGESLIRDRALLSAGRGWR